MQAPGRPEEDREDGFRHGGWQAPLVDGETVAVITQSLQRMDALLLGRKTYDIFAAYWPTATGVIAEKLNQVPKFVASRSPRDLRWTRSTPIRGDLAAEVAAIKGRHREVHVIGSGDLVQTLLRQGLVDRLDLWVYPLVLGSGKRLFEEGVVPTSLRLTGSRTFPKGSIHLEYESVGTPTYGDMTAPT